jgi:hypothetical protein
MSGIDRGARFGTFCRNRTAKNRHRFQWTPVLQQTTPISRDGHRIDQRATTEQHVELVEPAKTVSW